MERDENYQGRVDRSAVVACLGLDGGRSWLDCHSTTHFSAPDLKETLSLKACTVDKLRLSKEHLQSRLRVCNDKWESTLERSDQEILILATKMQSGLYDLLRI